MNNNLEMGTNSLNILIGNDITHASITCTKENWSVASFNKNFTIGEALECCPIDIRHGDNRWQGTIQDFMAIKNYTVNALAKLEDAEWDTDEPRSYAEEIAELKQLLSHFK